MKIPENPPSTDGYWWMLNGSENFSGGPGWEIVRLTWYEYSNIGERLALVCLCDIGNFELEWDEVRERFSEMEGPIVRTVPSREDRGCNGENQGCTC